MKKRLIIFSLILTLFFAISPFEVHAQAWRSSCLSNSGVATLRCIPDVFSNLVNGALIFAGSVAVILIIYAGINLVMSGGDQKKVQGARQTLTFAIIGLVIVLCSFGIIYFIGYLTGTHCIENMTLGGCQ
jgi:hypothetical protein